MDPTLPQALLKMMKKWERQLVCQDASRKLGPHGNMNHHHAKFAGMTPSTQRSLMKVNIIHSHKQTYMDTHISPSVCLYACACMLVDTQAHTSPPHARTSAGTHMQVDKQTISHTQLHAKNAHSHAQIPAHINLATS